MNSTSCGCKLVSSAARSPARWMTGPDVARNPTPISRATICASVVLPRPGGPCSSTWSSGSRRAFAAWTKMRKFSRCFDWPMKSSSDCGRRPTSAVSSASGCGATTRLPSALTVPAPASPARTSASILASPPRRLRRIHHRAIGGALGIAEIYQRRDRIGDRARRRDRAVEIGIAISPTLSRNSMTMR